MAKKMVIADPSVTLGAIPGGRCDKPSACFSGLSCDDILNSFVNAVGVEQPTCSTLTRDGCDCSGCMCGEGVGQTCESSGGKCGAAPNPKGNGNLVCRSWPEGELFVDMSTSGEIGRRLAGLEPVGTEKICVPPDWDFKTVTHFDFRGCAAGQPVKDFYSSLKATLRGGATCTEDGMKVREGAG